MIRVAEPQVERDILALIDPEHPPEAELWCVPKRGFFSLSFGFHETAPEIKVMHVRMMVGTNMANHDVLKLLDDLGSKDGCLVMYAFPLRPAHDRIYQRHGFKPSATFPSLLQKMVSHGNT